MTEEVTFIVAGLSHYRKKFHGLVKSHLSSAGVNYRLIVSPVKASEAGKCDTGTLEDTILIDSWRLQLKHTELIYQPYLLSALKSDLVVIIQENKYLLNYVLQTIRPTIRPRIAFFGHGRNFQCLDREATQERWKRFWATKVDWWFAYTAASASYIASLGFPCERITVFNNSIDTHELLQWAGGIGPECKAARLSELGLKGGNVTVFVGGLYEEKRLEFLFAAADIVRTQVPDYELIVVGGGPGFDFARRAADSRPWLRVLGPRFGVDKAEIMTLAKLFLMPGLVGLAVLDAGVLGLPLITTDYPKHSPEIAYLQDGVSGVMTRPWTSVDAYASEIITLLTNPERIKKLSDAARVICGQFTIESMAERFAEGVLQALKVPK